MWPTARLVITAAAALALAVSLPPAGAGAAAESPPAPPACAVTELPTAEQLSDAHKAVLGQKWAENGLGEHASVASFARFTVRASRPRAAPICTRLLLAAGWAAAWLRPRLPRLAQPSRSRRTAAL